MATAPPSPPRYEPKPRYGHCSALVEGKWISYGGDFGADGGVADPPTSVDVFDVNSEVWEEVSTSGTPPPGVGAAACTAVGSKLYHFGGFDGKQHYNMLHCLDTKTKVWSSITPNNSEASPMIKGRMAVTSYKKLIVFIGGYGDIPTNRHQDVHYVAHPDSEDQGWTNEVVCYDTEQNMWLRPTITGTQPPPCSDMSLTKMDSHRAVMFGGVGEGNELISPDVYILDMLHWTWTNIPASQTPQHPCARAGHSAVSLHDPDCYPANPALLVMWGTADGEVFRDCWIFHLNQKLWRKMILPETLRCRSWHTSSILYFSLVTKCINFGGLDTSPNSDDPDDFAPIAQTTIVEMSCSGGNPAEWIITDVITSSQLGQGNRLPKHMQLSMEEEMRHLTACDEAMRKKGKVDYCFGACLLNGPPRVGKSTFFYRITGRRLLPSDASCETTSTGVAERILQVVIKKSSSYIARAIKPGMNWQIVTLSQEAVTMLKAILSSQSSLVLQSQVQPPSLPLTSEFESLSSEAVDTTAHETVRQPVAGGVSGAAQSHLRMFNFRRHKMKSRQIPGYQVPLEIFQKALRSKEWASAEDLFKHLINLYFSDVGGQPEFQEVLPAIIAGPSVFFILFKLPDSLSQKYRVQYIESSTRKTIKYESSFTVKESILCSLSSASSMCRFVTRNSSELEPINPKVFIIATHKDKAGENHIKNVQRELKDTLESTEFYKKGIVVFASQSEPAFTINNLSDDDEDVSNIRQRVEKIIAEDPSFKVSVPAPWLALSLSLRLVESSVISYESCCTIANDCGIDDEEEIKEALWFLHNKLGVIRYFDQVPELHDIVVCDPQVIFDILTNLITRTFTFEETQDACASEEFQQKGIFPSRMIDKISSHLNEPLTGSKVVTLLKHLRVVAEIYDDKNESASSYLVPCALSHAPCHSEPTVGQKRKYTLITDSSPDIPSLCILFRCGYCPKGIFGALIADLLNHGKTKLRWLLIDDTIFRDQVSFHVGREHHKVKISSHITLLEVDISADTSRAKSVQQRNVEIVCNSIRLEIEQSLIRVSKTLHYGSGAAFSFGFYCTSCSGSPPADCGDEDDPVVMSCKKCKSVDLNENQRLWFGERATAVGVLTTNDLPSIMRKIWDARVKWYNIGLELTINPGTLDAIEKNSSNVEDRFREMLVFWLRNQPQPTKALLSEALRSQIVGFGHFAEQIL